MYLRVPAPAMVQRWSGAGRCCITCLIEAVNHALGGCPTAAPTLSLSVHVARIPPHTRFAPWLISRTAVTCPWRISRLQCHVLPKFYKAIAFDVVGPHDTTVLVENPVEASRSAPRFHNCLHPANRSRRRWTSPGSNSHERAAAMSAAIVAKRRWNPVGTRSRLDFSTRRISTRRGVSPVHDGQQEFDWP